jgi:hypothetical protein
VITVAECKEQCSIELDVVDFDALFTRTIPVVVAVVKNAINRPLYQSQDSLAAAVDALDVGDTSLNKAIVVTEDLRHAMLMLIAHLFENREATSTMTVKSVPMAFDYLVGPYRCINI